jgi:Na+/proline symporter
MMNADLIRILLLAVILVMALLACFYLRQRKLTISEYIRFGLLALFVPLLGPFLVILFKPGEPRNR